MATMKERKDRSEIYIFTERFTVGEIITAMVVKLIDIPGDASYYVLETGQKNRLLLPTEPYRHFGISIGQILSCSIDKINCSGRIFIEPLHPGFVSGQTYSFKVLNSFEVYDRKGRVHRHYQLQPNSGEVYEARLDRSLVFRNASIIKCKFERTRKGRLELCDCTA